MTDWPTAELHVHLEGTVEVELLVEIARRNGVALPTYDAEVLRARYAFTDLQSFLDILHANLAVLRTEQDFHDLAAGLPPSRPGGRCASRRDVLRPADAPRQRHPVRDRDRRSLRGTRRGPARPRHVRRAHPVLPPRARHGCRDADARRCPPVPRRLRGHGHVLDRGRLPALALRGASTPAPPPRGCTSSRTPARRVRPSTSARRSRCSASSGSITATARIEDPELVRRLVDLRMPLTVCPLSNVALRTAPRELSRHPLPGMLAAGLVVTVNSDDPAYFGGYIDDNYGRSPPHCRSTRPTSPPWRETPSKRASRPTARRRRGSPRSTRRWQAPRTDVRPTVRAIRFATCVPSGTRRPP